MSRFATLQLALLARRRRILALLAFAGLFLAAGLTARLIVGTNAQAVELDRLFQVGGYPLVSALLLLGWAIGRFPMIAIIVLLAGVFSDERTSGRARLVLVRPGSPLRVYTLRLALFAILAFAISALLLPAFDLIVLGTWAGPATLVLIAAYIIAYGGLMALLSVWTRGDAWIAAFLAASSIIWHALRQAGIFADAPLDISAMLSILLPPHGALFLLESAFADLAPIPWDAFLYVVGWGLTALVLAAWSLSRREV
jgi:ABC-type transport system involved in multi-copper enzyme maturation permease subunit